MKLGLHLGFWGARPPVDDAARVRAAEDLGFDSVWSAEAYGSDALTPLAWYGAATTRVRLGTAVMQLSARSPVATAIAAMTLDHLTGGRFVLGLGVSGPQVVEGWYGGEFARPLARTREYVDIVRAVLARREPVTSPGPHYPLPIPGGTGLGKPLRSILHPLRADLPIVLAAEGPRNVALAAEIADGWFPMFFCPERSDDCRRALEEGFARRPGGRPEGFEVISAVPVVIGDDVETAADEIRPLIALYVGGMGAAEMNFHFDLFARMGFEADAARIRAHYLDGRRADAAGAVSTAMVEAVALVGPEAKIRAEFERWRGSLLTTMLVDGPPELMQTMTEVRDSHC